MGSMFVAIIFIGGHNISSVQPVVAIERTVFYRERAAGMYSALPYAFGQVILLALYVYDINVNVKWTNYIYLPMRPFYNKNLGLPNPKKN